MYRKELEVKLNKPFDGSWGDGVSAELPIQPGHHVMDYRYTVETSDDSATQVDVTLSPSGVDGWSDLVTVAVMTYGSPSTTADWVKVKVNLLVVDVEALPSE